MAEEETDGSMVSSTYYTGHRSTTPSPTRGQFHMDRSGYGSDHSHMTAGHRSGTPSPTRHIMDRPGNVSMTVVNRWLTHLETFMILNINTV